MQDTELLQQLVDDIGTARKLLELIDAEYQALAERNLAGLEQLLTQKQTLLALLGQHGAFRSQTLAKAQLSADKKGLATFVANSAIGDDILAHAEQLESVLETCRNSNDRNGKLIRANKSAVGAMLHVLQGSNQTPDLYDRRGATARTANHRPLSQA
ncbi:MULTISPECIES: flagella synthesis protein FlgN [Pseudomonadaceae]|uniref:flagella synthesis protein FlgN n=1 Tax=Pseudomonadaceae TaxID=135621 RepID=UPI0015E2980F|nr:MULTISPECIES: flagellar protein FlgN [Pseudomonadaceae]MBA1278525.1 flagellar protein FlgN [Stutzerimonas stutzeri]MBC8648209.1 flagellar protein FlgN [Pseudomonas sp. MT4]QXY90167.1 flagellar protein FlgN [Pseudomonas sp. MTM4]